MGIKRKLKSLHERLSGSLVWAQALTKAQIRSKILLKLNKQKEEERKRLSHLIGFKLFKSKEFKKAKNIMFYIAQRGEVETKEMIKEARRSGKTVSLPVCEKNKDDISPCILEEKTCLKKGRYGIYEPFPRECVPIESLELVIVPGIAFDKEGSRLGRGKGCYDRFLKRLPQSTASIGLAFCFQIIPSLPAFSHDVRVKKVIWA